MNVSQTFWGLVEELRGWRHSILLEEDEAHSVNRSVGVCRESSAAWALCASWKKPLRLRNHPLLYHEALGAAHTNHALAGAPEWWAYLSFSFFCCCSPVMNIHSCNSDSNCGRVACGVCQRWHCCRKGWRFQTQGVKLGRKARSTLKKNTSYLVSNLLTLLIHSGISYFLPTWILHVCTVSWPWQFRLMYKISLTFRHKSHMGLGLFTRSCITIIPPKVQSRSFIKIQVSIFKKCMLSVWLGFVRRTNKRVKMIWSLFGHYALV